METRVNFFPRKSLNTTIFICSTALQYSQRPTVINHYHKGSHCRNDTGNQLRQRVADELPEGFGVIGMVAYHVAIGMSIKNR